MSVLNPTPAELPLDAAGRPYFLWDTDTTLEGLRAQLRTDDRETKAWLVGKLMRQAKPDDVFSFVTIAEIRDLWADLRRHLGKTKPFWEWLLLDAWKV